MGLPATLDSPDRHILEQRILPYYASRKDLHRVLFVGCDWYTKHYKNLFRHLDYWTIDMDPRQAKYGAKNHLVGSFQDIQQYFQPVSLDLILCNGVFGYGLNNTSDLSHAIDGCFSCLRPGGELMLGWNDVKDHSGFDPAGVIENAGFNRLVLEPLGQWRTTLNMQTRHTFESYIRPML